MVLYFIHCVTQIGQCGGAYLSCPMRSFDNNHRWFRVRHVIAFVDEVQERVYLPYNSIVHTVQQLSDQHPLNERQATNRTEQIVPPRTRQNEGMTKSCLSCLPNPLTEFWSCVLPIMRSCLWVSHMSDPCWARHTKGAIGCSLPLSVIGSRRLNRATIVSLQHICEKQLAIFNLRMHHHTRPFRVVQRS